MSELHLGLGLERLKVRYKSEVDQALPKVPYMETFTGTASGSYRHKKQTGGSGEFAEVHIEVSPSERGAGVVYENAIVGGAIDKVYIPAVDLPGIFDDTGIDLASWTSPNWKFDAGVHNFGGDAAPDAGTSTLKAWDPVAQRLVWEAPNPGAWNAGTLTTAGNLVFQGQADGRLVAYAADDGDQYRVIRSGTGRWC